MPKKAGLSDKQERFCREYITDHDATKAAIRSGYSHKTAGAIGAENLKKPQIRTRIEELEIPVCERLGITHQYVLTTLKEIRDKSLQAVPVMKYDREQKRMIETGQYVFDSNGANRATELMMKHLGMLTERHEINGSIINVGAVIVEDQETADELTNLRRNANATEIEPEGAAV